MKNYLQNNNIIYWNMEEINERIKKEICYNTLSELTDEKLMNVYKEWNSLKIK